MILQDFRVYKDDKALTPALSCEIQPGRITCLAGESGAGKSLLMQAMAGILPEGLKVEGRVTPANLPKGSGVVYVHQDASAALNPALRIEQLFDETIRMHKGKPDREQMRSVLELFGLSDAGIPSRFPYELSGGQKQRLNLALALCCNPEVLLLDEVTSALDKKNATHLLNIIKGYAGQHTCTVLVASHDMPLMEAYSYDIIYLNDLKENKVEFLDETNKSDSLSYLTGSKPIFFSENIHFSYKNAPELLKEVSLGIRPGEKVLLTGESGSGKSTLLKILYGAEKVSTGTIGWEGVRTHFPEEDLPYLLQVIFQDGFSNLPPFLKIWEIISEGAFYLGRVKRSDRVELARNWLQRTGLREEYLHRLPHELSGGERQRVGIARALACEPKLLLCDEVTANLDRRNTRLILEMLHQFASEKGIALLCISHEPELFPFRFDRSFTLSEGRLYEEL